MHKHFDTFTALKYVLFHVKDSFLIFKNNLLTTLCLQTTTQQYPLLILYILANSYNKKKVSFPKLEDLSPCI